MARERAARLLEQARLDDALSILVSPMRRGGLPTCSLGEGDGRRDHVAVGQLVDQAGGGALAASMKAAGQ